MSLMALHFDSRQETARQATGCQHCNLMACHFHAGRLRTLNCLGKYAGQLDVRVGATMLLY